MPGTAGVWDESGRTCNRCANWKPWDDFQKKSSGVNGRESRCRECRTQGRYDWIARNAERHREYNRTYLADYYKRNRRQLIHDNIAKYGGRAEGSYSLGEWDRLLARFGGLCAYCRVATATQREHVLPISRGGTNHIGNILPACWDCNISKGSMTLMEWRLSGKAPEVMRIDQGEVA